MADAICNNQNTIHKYDFETGTFAMEVDVLAAQTELAEMIGLADDLFQEYSKVEAQEDRQALRRRFHLIQSLLGQSRDLANALQAYEDHRRLQVAAE